jgi:hypothetical protein
MKSLMLLKNPKPQPQEDLGDEWDDYAWGADDH